MQTLQLNATSKSPRCIGLYWRTITMLCTFAWHNFSSNLKHITCLFRIIIVVKLVTQHLKSTRYTLSLVLIILFCVFIFVLIPNRLSVAERLIASLSGEKWFDYSFGKDLTPCRANVKTFDELGLSCYISQDRQ